MRSFIVLCLMVFCCTTASAVTRVSLQDGTGMELGTGTNPLNVEISAITIDGVDSSIYTTDAGAYPTKLLQIGADGSIYGEGSKVIIDSSVYTASAGTGAARMMCISVDGTLYGSATGCY